MLPHLLFLSIAVGLLVRSYRNIRKGTIHRVAVSTMAASIYVLCLWLPGILQASGQLSSKLDRAGVLGPPDWTELSGLAVRWSLELAVIVLAEAVVLALSHAPRDDPQARHGFADFKLVAYTSLAVGLATLVISQRTFEQRGEVGDGMHSLMASFFVSGLAILAYFLPAGTINRIVLLLGTALLATSYVRSPLVVIAIAFTLGALHRGVLRSRRSIVLFTAGAVMLVFGASAMSAIRGSLIRNEVVSAQDQLLATVSEPLLAPFRGGIDTLDGYRFSRVLSSVIPPRPLDPLMAVGSFVPRTLWAEKPDELSVTVSQKYLNYRGSGQFLSPVGYLTLVTGGYATALILLAAFSVILAAWSFRTQRGLWSLIVMVILFRFFIGGAAFDISYGLRLAIPWVLFGTLFTGLRMVVRIPPVAVQAAVPLRTLERGYDDAPAPSVLAGNCSGELRRRSQWQPRI